MRAQSYKHQLRSGDPNNKWQCAVVYCTIIGHAQACIAVIICGEPDWFLLVHFRKTLSPIIW